MKKKNHLLNAKDTKYAILVKKCANQNNKYANQNTKFTNQKTKYTKQNTKYANQNKKYVNQNTKDAISFKSWCSWNKNVNSTPQQRFTLFCQEEIFAANSRTFSRTFYRLQKCGGVLDMTNMRYVPTTTLGWQKLHKHQSMSDFSYHYVWSKFFWGWASSLNFSY